MLLTYVICRVYKKQHKPNHKLIKAISICSQKFLYISNHRRWKNGQAMHSRVRERQMNVMGEVYGCPYPFWLNMLGILFEQTYRLHTHHAMGCCASCKSCHSKTPITEISKGSATLGGSRSSLQQTGTPKSQSAVVKAHKSLEDVNIGLGDEHPSLSERATSPNKPEMEAAAIALANQAAAEKKALTLSQERAPNRSQNNMISYREMRSFRVNLDEIGMSAAFFKHVDKPGLLADFSSSQSSQQPLAPEGIIMAAADCAVESEASKVESESCKNMDDVKAEMTRTHILKLNHFFDEVDRSPDTLRETVERRRDFDKKYRRIRKHAAAQKVLMNSIQDSFISESSAHDSSAASVSQQVPTKTSLAL